MSTVEATKFCSGSQHIVLTSVRFARADMSQQDPAFRAEYEEYSARRAAEGLPKVSYRNYLRQWRRSDEGHTARGDPSLGGKGGKGGATPPPPPPKRRQAITEGGDVPPPPTVKVKRRRSSP